MKKMKRAAMLLGCLCMLCFTALHIAAADVPDPCLLYTSSIEQIREVLYDEAL